MPGEIIPPRKRPDTDNEYFEILSKAVFQAGFSFKVVHNKWSGIKKTFSDFNPQIIASWGPPEIADALDAPEMIRNSNKINAIVSNANTFNQLASEYGSFGKYVDFLLEKPYEERKKALSAQFKWLGKTGSYFFFYSINDPDMPAWDDR
ncbi:MAG: DNA-3-methyladenine glycosylase I [Candidatus Heimdallarchaeota archaeon]|nr:DNA-3-methyladenine glycosylase I [Candidatus Heimdallarchaeota archaeon]